MRTRTKGKLNKRTIISRPLPPLLNQRNIMQYNKDMKPTLYIILGIVLITVFLYGLFWVIINEIFTLAIKLSGGM